MSGIYETMLLWSTPSMLLMTCICVISVAVSLYTWLRYPGTVLKYASRMSSLLLGLRQRHIEVCKTRLGYVERGRPRPGHPSLLMLHGFSADTNMYLPVVALLPRDQHVVLLDLPGHGESDNPPADQDLTLFGIASVVKQFVEAIKLNEERFHILGTSLGGAISAVYASVFPGDVAKTTLVCPAMLTPIETDFQRQVKEGNCLLLGNSVDEVATIINKCLYNKSILHRNRQVLLGISQQREHHKHFYEKVFEAITIMLHDHQNVFVERISAIQAPTQLIWGKHDELIHVSGVNELQRHLPRCVRVDVLERCGHVVSFDRPRSMASVLKKFIAYKETSNDLLNMN